MRIPGLRGKPKQEDRLQVLQDKVYDARQAVQQLHSDWQTYWQYYDTDKQLANLKEEIPNDEQKKDATVTNFLYSSTNTYVALLVQALEQWYVVATDDANDENAQALTEYLRAWSECRGVALEYWKMVTQARVTGTGVIKVYWNPLLDDVALEAVDPMTVFPDPAARRVDQCEFIALRNVYSEEAAERIFNGEGEMEKIDLDKAEYVSAGSSGYLADTRDDINEPPKSKRVEVWEVYHEFGDKLMIYTGRQVLFDGDNPTPGKRFPVFFFPAEPTINRFWSTSPFAALIPIQRDINKRLTRINTHQRYTAPPAWYTDDWQSKLTRIVPGQVHRVHPGTGIRPLEGPQLTPQMFQAIDWDRRHFDIVGGVQDVNRGEPPSAAASGILVQQLQQTATTRLTGPLRFWAHTWMEVGQTVLETMQRWYAEERMVPVVRDGVGARVRISPDMLGVPQETGEYNEDGEPIMEVVPIPYRVVVQPSGDLPLSAAAQAQLAIQLAQMGAIDVPALLKAVNFKYRDEVVQRAQQQAQAQQAGREAGEQIVGQQPTPSRIEIARALNETMTPEQFRLLGEILANRVDPKIAEDFISTLTPEQQRLVAQLMQEET